VINHGTNTNESVDYADFVHPVAEDVVSKKSNFGILLCGSANGVAITANKHQKIRAGLAWNKEIVHLIRSHNNANILCIPARFTALQQVIEMVDAFLDTPFEGGRHQTRIDKIPVSC
ncbi:MAG TPA: RpiB/LacA/LacB family sugar-phosphate isomerase, partial [Mariniflexile sp.]|nr:RpiB/LacA/LacB family sugar-phosphate isomerase [Mariniflexile sp.]